MGKRPEVFRYVAENIGSPLRISDNAARFFVSGNKLNKDFRAFPSIPVHQFIVHVKISIAQYELKRDDPRVREVARRMGFENDSYFFSFFRKKYGHDTPAVKKGNQRPTEYQKAES